MNNPSFHINAALGVKQTEDGYAVTWIGGDILGLSKTVLENPPPFIQVNSPFVTIGQHKARIRGFNPLDNVYLLERIHE